MRAGTWRPLSAGERALAAAVFGAGLDAGRLRLLALPAWPRAFVPNGRLICWPAGSAFADFTEAPLDVQAVLVHELTNVWQAQNGVNLLLAKLKAGDGPAAYAYDLADGRAFEALNIEQQASLIEHAWLAARGGRAPHARSDYADILKAWPWAGKERPFQV